MLPAWRSPCRCSKHLVRRGPDGTAAGAAPRRMVCVNTPLGLHPAFFFPETAGRDYKPSPYLEVLKEFRDDFTVISGLSHPDVGPSHDSNLSFLTSAPSSGAQGGVQEQHLARPVRRRTDLRRDTLSDAHAVLRGLRPLLDEERSTRAHGGPALERVRPALPRGPSRTGSGRGAPARRRPEHPRLGARPGAEDEGRARGGRSREARRVFHERARARAAAGAGRRVVEEAQAQSERQAAGRRSEWRRPRGQDAALVRPDPPGAPDRLVAADHPGIARHQQRAADPRREPGAPRPVAPRSGPRQDRPAQDARA